MTHRLAGWLKSDQAVIVLFGTHALVVAVLLGWETYITGKGRFLAPWVWPPVFLAAWAACVMYHRHRTSGMWWRWSCALLVFAYGSRAVTLLLTANSDDDYSARFAIGVATWTLVALCVEVLWVRIVTPHRGLNGVPS